MNEIIVKLVNFKQNFTDIKFIRETVFVKEQHVPLELEWDGYDQDAIHVLAWFNKHVAGTARLLADGRIGRMAVMPQYRKHGVGTAMLDCLVSYAQHHGLPQPYLSAQKTAVDFYAKYGFEVCSGEYQDAGIPHYTMRL